MCLDALNNSVYLTENLEIDKCLIDTRINIPVFEIDNESVLNTQLLIFKKGKAN